MKIIEAINQIDALKSNSYTQSEKVAWLSTVEGLIKRNIIDGHEGDTEITFNGYDENTPLDTELIAYAPYDRVYVLWLESQIDYFNGEYARYNNSIITFKDMYDGFACDYNRTHMPKERKIKYF